MKEYIYQNRRLYIFLMTIWLIIIIIVLLALAPSYTSFLFLLGVISSVVVLLTIPQILSKKIIINDIGILESDKKMHLFYREIKKELYWNEIGHIFDDYVQPILFYPPYKLHIFHLMPKDNVSKPFKRISISWWIKDYKDLLLQVVSHVGPEVVIDDFVYKFLDKYKKDL